MGPDGNKGGRWRLNVSFFQDPVFRSQIEKELDHFFLGECGFNR